MKVADSQYVTDALWLGKFEWGKIPEDIKLKLLSKKHSPEGFGARMQVYLQWLLHNPQSFNPDYAPRYKALIAASKELTPHQAYVFSTNFLGLNASQGYDPIPAKANLQFPEAHAPDFSTQVGWHFFVGSVWDEDGQEYGVELMFFRQALLSPPVAHSLGLTDIENQVIEIQLGISKAGDKHHQADPVVVAGTSGLINFKSQPYLYELGKNKIQGIKKDNFFPLKLVARGVDKSENKLFELGVDIELTSGKEYLLQGGDGCMPSVAGMGTLYYSIPNIQIKNGSTLQYGDKKIKLKRGLMWFDHQWGFLAGNCSSAVLRAANNVSSPGPSGWDWFMAQFSGDRQLTMVAPHSKKNIAYYFKSGPKSPGSMKVSVSGKYMDEKKGLHSSWGILKVTKWVQAKESPNPKLYPITRVWHPNKWEFSFDNTVPKDIRNFSMEQIVPTAQTNFFANGSQYNEGAVYLQNQNGEDIGRGFAESVEYADTSKNIYRLAGIVNNPELTSTLRKQTASWSRRIISFLYLITHQKDLKETIAKASGMDFITGPPTKKT